MTLFALLFSIMICSASLAWGFAQSGFTSFSIWVLIVGAGWFFAIWQEWKWYSSVALSLSAVVAAIGLWFGLAPGWMFAGGLFALFAWDLTDFRQRLRLIANDHDLRGIERRHLARVSLLAFIGLLLASIAMFFVRAQFTFEWGALFLIVTLFGLIQLSGWFRK